MSRNYLAESALLRRILAVGNLDEGPQLIEYDTGEYALGTRQWLILDWSEAQLVREIQGGRS